MARRDKFQTARIKQKSAFLKLPGEIRTLIYRAALVKNTPIELWPHKFIEKNLERPDLAERLRKSVHDANMLEWTRVRDQYDLNYVRKEMATGILATCQQIRMEATSLFWRENCFRFSGDFDWRGLRRFLVSIGPDARSRIRSLDVAPPGWASDNIYQPIDTTQYMDVSKAVTAKNHPKTHMHKSLPFSRWTSEVFQHEDNVRFVCEMFRSEGALKTLNIALMEGWSFWQLDSIYSEWLSQQISVLATFQTLKHFCQVTVTLESGSAMLGRQSREFLNKFDITLVAHPGSRMVAQRPFKEYPECGSLSDTLDITELTVWAPPGSDDFITDSFNIFDETNRIVSPGRGGKAFKSTYYGRRRMERILKGFGGCRFVERCGEFCNDCNQQLRNPQGTWQKHNYWCVHCKGKTGYTWKAGIEVRKLNREKRVSQQAEVANENSWWQG